ncbi:MAG TPA: sugar phosphate isomerase/epimerase family protein [Bryobacteraceae bacterium]|nr:sugar phosphate isomerase/epimerase family protein [Bryobacteraceae bacterium]
MEIGMMFWAGRDDLKEIKSLGLNHGQLGIAGDIALTREFTAVWKTALAQEQFSVVTVVCAYEGESYADIPTVQSTVGFIPPHTRTLRERRTMQASDLAAALGVPGIGCHIGFVPDDRTDGDYIAVRDAVRRICDHAASHGQTFALETGQESAEVLLRFMDDTGRGNLKINFDPANMILYGTGDPIEALHALAPYVISVHAKDADWPPRAIPGALGRERRLGEGAVGMGRFIEALRRHGYGGAINIEREIEDQRQRMVDIRDGVQLLRRLLA